MEARRLFTLSLGLNVLLISRIAYEGRSGRGRLCYPEATHQATLPSSAEPQDGGDYDDDDDDEINLDPGDPTMYENFWEKMGEKSTVVIPGWQSMSYFTDVKRLCWFLEAELANQITRLHTLVGNAVTKDRHIVLGTGSAQLFNAALYALSLPNATSEPMSVISAAPYYSVYPLITDLLKSGLYKWAGDAHMFCKDKPYIEVVTNPNNPDGFARQGVVNGKEGILVHDLAYYWPQYTSITSPADHDLMMFTLSKSTGHAGIRIGWAFVKDEEVAKRMTRYIELSTIGVSRDSQFRATKILQTVIDSHGRVGSSDEGESFFEYGYNLMAKRWKQLRAAVEQSRLFSLPEFASEFCSFRGRAFEPQPAFAWLKCEGETEDCGNFLRSHKILVRGGVNFGVSSKYARVSMLSRDKPFNHFIKRMSN